MKKLNFTLHNRRQMVKDALWEVNETLSEEDRAKKFEKMSASAYSFYRGSNHLYWEDFYNDWQFSLFGGRQETLTWINGDAHVYNFGAYSNHYGEALYGLDDFDDSLVADYQYDLWRMAVSIVLDARANETFNAKEQKKAVKKFAKAYLKEIRNYSKDDNEKEVILTKKTAPSLIADYLEKVEEKNDRSKMLKKWTIEEGDTRVFNFDKSKLEKISEEKYKKMCEAIDQYKSTLSDDFTEWDDAHFKIKDIAKRVKAGTGSIGSDRYYVLLEGGEEHEEDDRILDVKFQDKPPLYYHMNSEEQKEYEQAFLHEGERHALAFKALAEHPDKYLGWLTLDDQIFSVRELSPFKDDYPTHKLKDKSDFYDISEIWGQLLATRHERASYQVGEETFNMPKTLAELTEDKEKDFVKLVQSISLQYADCVQNDFSLFVELNQKEII